MHKYQIHAACGLFLGVIIGITAQYYLNNRYDPLYDYKTSEVHVHSDFILHIDGMTYDFTDDKYQSIPGLVRHQDVHLHDNEDHIIHRHAEDITLSDFLSSIGFTLTEGCITTDSSTEFCNDNTNQLSLYVNNLQKDSIADYISQEADRILLYYGSADSNAIADLQAQITDESCIYSGTCPERGIAPPESCGLTCEI